MFVGLLRGGLDLVGFGGLNRQGRDAEKANQKGVEENSHEKIYYYKFEINMFYNKTNILNYIVNLPS